MQQFLYFWNAHNVTIIEVLIAIIVLAVAVIIYQMAFKSGDDSVTNSAQLEKTLQKILEAQQGGAKTEGGEKSASAEALALHSDEAHAAARSDSEDIVQLKAALKEKQAQIEKLKVSVTELSEGTAAAAAPTGGETVGGAAGADTTALENRIRELEANLAEYEIISEDIADLSKFKEENLRLNQELLAFKAGGGAGPTSNAASAAATPPADSGLDAAVAAALAIDPVATVDEAIAAVAAEASKSEEVVSANPEDEKILKEFEESQALAAAASAASETPPEVSTPAAVAEAAPLAPSESSSVIDDELMKEFAAAVEGQKAAPVPNETDKLMNEFETFIKKG